jgi:hypothetical protein
MGLKSGSRDAGLDEEEETEAESVDEAASDGAESTTESVPETSSDSSDAPTQDRSETQADTTSESSDDRPSMDSIPYVLRRDKVNEGRQQVPYFLRDEVVDAEDDLQTELEHILGEDVYKSDYREAAMVVAQRNPELVAAVLREWGYDLN